ncbi:MAG: peptidase M14, partial [Dokdonella sp.]
DARVSERLARAMLAKDPALQREFDAKIAADADFAKSPGARLDFFYDRSPWYTTQHVGAYPVVRLDTATLKKL